jgi:hypothetical protein
VATRDVYQKQFQAQLRVWDANVKQWKAKAHNANADLRVAYQTELKNLSAQRAVAQKKFDELVNHDEDAWESLKEGAEKAWLELRKATDNVTALFGHFAS